MSRRYFNADETMSLHDPLFFKVGGQEYKVNELTDELMQKVVSITEEMDEDSINENGPGIILARQLSLLTDEPVETFEGVSIRVKTGILDWIMETLRDPRGKAKAKNLRRR